MDPFFFVFAGIVVAAVIYSLFFTPKALLKRKINRHTEKEMGDVQEGEMVKIKGKVVLAGNTLTAPLSGRKCSYYHVLVTRHRNKHQEEIISEEKAGTVIIQNGDHFAVISTSLAKTYIHQDKRYDSGFLNDATEPLENFLKRHKQKSEGFLGFNKELTYKEGVLEEGETIVVAGKASWVSKTKFRLDLPCERVLMIRANGHENPVYLSDEVEIVNG